MRSLIFRTAVFVGGVYLTKSVYSAGDNPGVGGGKLPFVTKLAHADFKSTNDFNLKAANLGEDEKFVWDDNWDRRATEPTARRGVRRTLLFIRHGDYHKRRGSLNEKGVAQATWAGLRLKEMVDNGKKIDKIIVSTMPRARESFDAIKTNLNTDHIQVKMSDLITEGYPCLPEPKSSNHHADYEVFQEGARIEAAFRNIFYRPPSVQEGNTYEVYICHANVIRYFVMRALQLPPEAWRRFNLGNASFTEMSVFADGGVVLNTFGERAHVKKNFKQVTVQ